MTYQGHAKSRHLIHLLALVAGLTLSAGIAKAEIRSADPRTPSAALEPRQQDPVITRLGKLTAEEELALFLGSGAQVGGRRYSPTARLGRLMEDPALATVYSRIDDRWLAVPGTEAMRSDTRGAIELKVMIARNLYFRDLPPTAQSVPAEALRILDLRLRFQELAMFEGRNVLFAASDDQHPGGKGPVFGRHSTRQRLSQISGEVDFMRRGETADLEIRISEVIASAQKLTFLFEGHGRGDALKLDGALKPAQLARLLASRVESAGTSTPILILDACQSHNFSRQLLSELERLAPWVKPIVITPEEYGQDFVKPGSGDQFLDRDLGIAYRERVTLGDLFSEPRTMASVYVHGDDGRPAQIL